MAEKLIPLFREVYPEINFVTHEEIKPKRYYATYSMGLFFDDKECLHQPCDFRYVGLHRTAGYTLGVGPTEALPRIALPDDSRPIPEPYVCIAVQSTAQAKYWNNPGGWLEIVRFLQNAGYRVICIDQKAVHGTGLVWNQIPNGAEDETGDQPLTERARWLKHADFFVGLSSGLSWLAWAVGTKVVMISGFTHPLNEFATPYRLINYHTCNSCWNDPALRFDHKNFLWCPRHKDTPRQFECTRLITVDHVKATIQSIPGFGANKAKQAFSNIGVSCAAVTHSVRGGLLIFGARWGAKARRHCRSYYRSDWVTAHGRRCSLSPAAAVDLAQYPAFDITIYDRPASTPPSTIHSNRVATDSATSLA
jgi:autotransporter strand-loop-strand O-heptosyltransferase